jgi:hypothetical protein
MSFVDSIKERYQCAIDGDAELAAIPEYRNRIGDIP